MGYLSNDWWYVLLPVPVRIGYVRLISQLMGMIAMGHIIYLSITQVSPIQWVTPHLLTSLTDLPTVDSHSLHIGLILTCKKLVMSLEFVLISLGDWGMTMMTMMTIIQPPFNPGVIKPGWLEYPNQNSGLFIAGKTIELNEWFSSKPWSWLPERTFFQGV